MADAWKRCSGMRCSLKNILGRNGIRGIMRPAVVHQQVQPFARRGNWRGGNNVPRPRNFPLLIDRAAHLLLAPVKALGN